MNIFGNDIDPGDNNKDMEDQDADVCRVCRMEGSVYKNKVYKKIYKKYFNFLKLIYLLNNLM